MSGDWRAANSSESEWQSRSGGRCEKHAGPDSYGALTCFECYSQWQTWVLTCPAEVFGDKGELLCSVACGLECAIDAIAVEEVDKDDGRESHRIYFATDEQYTVEQLLNALG